jgi:phosphatidylinositol-3-phosphatase
MIALACTAATASSLLAGCGASEPGTPLSVGSVSALPRASSSHVVVIVMENAEYGEVIGSGEAPYVNSLARRYGLATRSYAVAHPSLPNYLALTSGSTHGVLSDCTGCAVAGPSIAEQLEAKGISWRAYLEGAPRPCFRGSEAGGYAKKHNPFVYYRSIAATPQRCARLVGFARLASDLSSGSLPGYVWITPNLCDDGHDCGVAAGDRFLARTVPSLLRELGPHGLLLLTWDEGSSDAGCCGQARGGHVATILAGPDVRRGGRDSAPIDTYGLLGTIEQALGLAPLGRAADPRSGRLTPLLSARRAGARDQRRGS